MGSFLIGFLYRVNRRSLHQTFAPGSHFELAWLAAAAPTQRIKRLWTLALPLQIPRRCSSCCFSRCCRIGNSRNARGAKRFLLKRIPPAQRSADKPYQHGKGEIQRAPVLHGRLPREQWWRPQALHRKAHYAGRKFSPRRAHHPKAGNLKARKTVDQPADYCTRSQMWCSELRLGYGLRDVCDCLTARTLPDRGFRLRSRVDTGLTFSGEIKPRARFGSRS